MGNPTGSPGKGIRSLGSRAKEHERRPLVSTQRIRSTEAREGAGEPSGRALLAGRESGHVPGSVSALGGLRPCESDFRSPSALGPRWFSWGPWPSRRRWPSGESCPVGGRCKRAHRASVGLLEAGARWGQLEWREDWQFSGDTSQAGPLTLLHPCRAKMVRRVTVERMASQGSL